MSLGSSFDCGVYMLCFLSSGRLGPCHSLIHSFIHFLIQWGGGWRRRKMEVFSKTEHEAARGKHPLWVEAERADHPSLWRPHSSNMFTLQTPLPSQWVGWFPTKFLRPTTAVFCSIKIYLMKKVIRERRWENLYFFNNPSSAVLSDPALVGYLTSVKSETVSQCHAWYLFFFSICLQVTLRGYFHGFWTIYSFILSKKD